MHHVNVNWRENLELLRLKNPPMGYVQLFTSLLPLHVGSLIVHYFPKVLLDEVHTNQVQCRLNDLA